MPFTSTRCPRAQLLPVARAFVISELTTISVIGVLVSVSCERNRSTTGNLPFGMR